MTDKNANNESIHARLDNLEMETSGNTPFTLTSEFGHTTPKQIWESKDVWFEKAKKSREDFEKMTDDQKDALVRLVTGAIERMHDRVPDWLPEGLTVEGGNFVDVSMRFLFTDIDKEIDRNETATSFQIAEALAESKAILADLDDIN